MSESPPSPRQPEKYRSSRLLISSGVTWPIVKIVQPSDEDDRIVLLFYRSERLCSGVLQFFRGCFEGVWLGLLSRERLSRIDEFYYRRHQQYSAENYNRQGFFGWERAAIEKHFTDVRRIAVTSAGGGREVVALLAAGYEAIGFEPNAELAESGNNVLAADGGQILPCEFDTWPPEAVGFDAAVVGWSGYMLIHGRATRVAFLRAAAAQLPPGAPILLSFVVRYGPRMRFYAVAAVGNVFRRMQRRERIDVGDGFAPMLVHFFTKDELRAELADGGFELVDYGTRDYGWAVARRTGSS